MARKRTIPLHERDRKSISVTYSKRRKTLFAKAAETSLQHQAPIAVLVSSAGTKHRPKFVGFGNPSLDSVLSSYLGCDARAAAKIDGGAKSLWEEVNELEIKVKGKKGRERKGGDDQRWWLRDIESMDLEELREFADQLEELKGEVKLRLESEKNPNVGEFSGLAGGDGKEENVEEDMDWYWKYLLA